jgi:hypothetical protein
MLGYTLSDSKRNKEVMRELQIPQITIYTTIQKKLERTC